MFFEDDEENSAIDDFDTLMKEEETYDEKGDESLKDTTNIDTLQNENKESFVIHQELAKNDLVTIEESPSKRPDEVENVDQQPTVEEEKNDSFVDLDFMTPEKLEQVEKEYAGPTVEEEKSDSDFVTPRRLEQVEKEKDAVTIVEDENYAVKKSDIALISAQLDEVDIEDYSESVGEEEEDALKAPDSNLTLETLEIGDQETVVKEGKSSVKFADSLSDGSQESQDNFETFVRTSVSKLQSEKEETSSKHASNGTYDSEPSSQRTETVTLFSSKTSEISSLSDQELVEVSVEDNEEFDRDAYCVLYWQVTRMCQEEGSKNTLLHRRMSEYYRKRRMYHVFDEGKMLQDEKKYNHCLDEANDLSERNEREQLRVRLELIRMKSLCTAKEKEVEELFQKFQNAEFEVSKELQSAAKNSEGSPNEAVTQRHLKRQRNQLSCLINMRLNFIKLQNRCNEKKIALDALDNLGPNCHLIDYMQLKIDNRNLCDKLEEKESELIKVRQRCEDTMQILAHIREKGEFVNVEMKSFAERLETLEEEYVEVREEVGLLQRSKDDYRKLISKLRSESGLLAKPILLRDMENARTEINFLSGVVKDYEDYCQYTALIVQKMRMVMRSPKLMSKLKAKLEGEAVGSVIDSKSTESEDFQFNFEDSFSRGTVGCS